MTVRELIRQLQAHSPDTVILRERDPEDGYLAEVEGITRSAVKIGSTWYDDRNPYNIHPDRTGRGIVLG